METAVRDLLANKVVSVPVAAKAEIALIAAPEAVADGRSNTILPLTPWETRCRALIGLLDRYRIVTTEELTERVATARFGKLGPYERCISGVSDVLLAKGILHPSDLALSMADVEMRAVAIPAGSDKTEDANAAGQACKLDD
ncbi:hypothetical protein [Sinorhizobium mexicanum]|uniref:Uncharacterized protein n=1 Tax=Sinorhizobium mexicanum TaxID=375549 RepID=A0A859QCX9_9HYPH|nr:hypothetical protein [Sinorhizobium mexicanum]MBP1881844.1 hypothetical protein [Sinorhizobium mexicanum]QLL61592.1 hypothetical protein FKV68_09105 [Sinorhizobium mexicanum]